LKTTTSPNKSILIIHGPNMTLVGKRYNGITIDKINRVLKKEATKHAYSLYIFQTNEEGKAVTLLQRYRNRVKGIILFPGPWQECGHVIKDTLGLLKLPCITLSTGEKEKLIKREGHIKDLDLLTGCKISIQKMVKLLNAK